MGDVASPRVAVVVPVHDAAPFLAQTLDSILAQGYGDWRAIVLDDVSTDASPDIAAGYAARHPDRFTLIRAERNLGVAAARNALIAAAADAELVALLDHDDWLREDYLQRMVGLYDDTRARGVRVGVVGCDARLHGPEGLLPDTWSERLGWFDEVTLDTLIAQNTIFARALIATDALRAVGGFEPATIGSDDFDLWLRIVHAGYEVAVTREALAVYRIHTGGMSRDRVTMSAGKIAAYDRLVARGGLTRSQRRAVRRRVRHLRAVAAGARLRQARDAGRWGEMARTALPFAGRALVAVAQDPVRWLRPRPALWRPPPVLRRRRRTS